MLQPQRNAFRDDTSFQRIAVARWAIWTDSADMDIHSSNEGYDGNDMQYEQCELMGCLRHPFNSHSLSCLRGIRCGMSFHAFELMRRSRHPHTINLISIVEGHTGELLMPLHCRPFGERLIKLLTYVVIASSALSSHFHRFPNIATHVLKTDVSQNDNDCQPNLRHYPWRIPKEM